jgi:hypothetical protein
MMDPDLRSPKSIDCRARLVEISEAGSVTESLARAAEAHHWSCAQEADTITAQFLRSFEPYETIVSSVSLMRREISLSSNSRARRPAINVAVELIVTFGARVN